MGIYGIESNLSEGVHEKIRGDVMLCKKEKTVIGCNDIFRDMPPGYVETEDFVVMNQMIEEVAKK